MCESTVFVKTKDGEDKVMEEVARIEVRGRSIVMSRVLGEEKMIDGRIASIDFLGHRLVIDPNP
jgi:predicted RNA-binding protein